MPTLDDALALAEYGFDVLLLRPYSKEPYRKARGRTEGGYKVATRDGAELRRIWRPDSNIGIACGASGLVVIDVDPKNGGDKSFENLQAEVGKSVFEDVPRVNSPTAGGTHYYYSAPAELEIRPQRRLSGIDILSDGSYVVAPPSIGCNGNLYSWAAGRGKGPELPKALIDYLGLTKKGRCGGQSVAPLGHSLSATVWSKGQRNRSLTSLAGGLHRKGHNPDEIRMYLRALNASNCQPPLPDTEVEGIVTSVLCYPNGIGHPWAFLCGWMQRGLSPNGYLLLSVLVRGADGDGKWSPNLSQLLAKTGFSKNTLYAARHELEQAGAIEVKERGSNLSSVYTLVRPNAPSNS